MTDIYNEIGYIKVVLENGLSQKWERDVKLLIRYWKEYEDYTKKQVREEARRKCEEAAARKNNPIYYNHIIHYKRLNKIIQSAWTSKTPLRQIMYIDVPQEVVDWFLNLEKDFKIPLEEYEVLKKRNPKVSFKANKAINWNRTKYLWTLYMWTRIQESYAPMPNVHNLKRYVVRFKEDADISANTFSMKNEGNYLYDLKLINITNKGKIIPIFMENYDVFKTPITDKNRVRITCGSPGEGDLYRIGYWLKKQKYGSFVCKGCGKEFAYDSLREKGGRPREFCKECADKNQHGKTGDSRSVVCIDCGKVIEVEKNDGKTIRCWDCQENYDRVRKRKWAQDHKKIPFLDKLDVSSGETPTPQTL